MSGPQIPERRTKVVATIGPASRERETLVELIEAGADVFRLNFSHGNPDEHAETIGRIRAASEETGKWVGILGDIPGPKLRLDEVEGGRVRIRSGTELRLTIQECIGTDERLPVSFDGLPKAVEVGDPIFLADGRIRLKATEVGDHEVVCDVETGGHVSSHQGVNLPGATSGMPSAGAEDLDWVEFAIDQDVDLLAVSFVREASDLAPINERIRSRGSDIPLIAKIEKPQALENTDEILEQATSGIMVARGDLGIELPIESMPSIQKRLIARAGARSKPVITATQMLASMVDSDRPTRAEVTDVANAIYDGTDAIMLSEETAVGEHPVAAVRMMDRIAEQTERDLPYETWLRTRVDAAEDDIAASVAQGAVGSTYRLGLRAIVVPTHSGRTARLVSALRPRVPVVAISPRKETVRRLNVLFGVRCVHHDDWDDLRELLNDSARIAMEVGVAEKGDLVAITAGLPDQEMGTNVFEIHRV
ncbi:MAG TPA: pyruvate kinase [Solirubrobacterales bacterium]|nr:pyruvate kinase [Solirubrobacterales bacterium]